MKKQTKLTNHARIPHYNAKRTTEAFQRAFPDRYLHDPTPIRKAVVRIATKCNVVSKADIGWKYVVKTNDDATCLCLRDSRRTLRGRILQVQRPDMECPATVLKPLLVN